MSDRIRVLFVGSFAPARKDGTVGGMLFACRSLVESQMSEKVEWVEIDSTVESKPQPPMFRRIWLATKRLGKLIVLAPRVQSGLIFAATGLSMYEKGLMALFLKALGKRVVFCPRDGRLSVALKKSRLQRGWFRLVARYCDAIICQSASWTAEFVARTGLPEDCFQLQRNWIDLREYSEVVGHRSSRTVSASVVFLFLGMITRNKGIYNLLDAIIQIRDQLDGARVIVCGKGPELTNVEAIVARHRLEAIVEFRGWVVGDAKHSVLAEADVLLLPSYHEGMPNSVLEGMASGLAIVASRVGGIPETLGQNEYGILIEPGDVDALADAMSLLLHDSKLRAELASKAIKRVAETHSVEQAWPNMLRLLTPDGSW